MVTIQLYDTGQMLEAKDAKITYVKTAGDLGQLTSVNSSFSWSMKFPKTPKNTQVLDGLGLVGSGSRKPYEKIYCNLLDNGMPIVVKGLLNIRETGEEYGVYIQEGFVDFLKDITNDTIGEALDLSPLDHTRDYDTIVNSFALTLPYAYLIADVNGGYLLNEANTTNLDPRYMVPYANVGYLWDLVFSTYGWTFSLNGQVRDEVDGLWMSYPSEIVFDDQDATLVGQLSATDSHAVPIDGSRREQSIRFDIVSFNNDYFLPLNTNQREYIVQQNGNYKLSYDSEGYVRLEDQWGNQGLSTYRTFIYVNGERVNASAGSMSNETETKDFQIQLNEGDIIQLGAYVTTIDLDTEVIVDSAFLDISYLNQGEVSFTQALIKYKISDFIKEVMTRHALTPFVDSDNKHIEFLTLDERLGYEYVDWSRWYSKRMSEKYLYRDYAQSNYLRHKYNDDGEDFNDGVLGIDNLNLETEKTVYQSQSFSPSQQLSPFMDSNVTYQVPRLQMFDAEVKESEGVIDIEYKFLKDRFFFVNHVLSNRDIYIDTVLVEGYPMASISGAVYRDIVGTKYRSFKLMSNDAKVHEIELALPLSEVVNLDLRKVFYFEREANYYILNRLTYKTGEKSRAEFLRIEPELNIGAFSNAFDNSFSI